MGTIWENELSLQYFLRSCKFVNLGSNYTNQQQVLNQGVQAPDLWCGWLPAWFGRSQVPSCVASEQFQIQPGIPCSFPLLAFKQNLPRFPEPGISGAVNSSPCFFGYQVTIQYKMVNNEDMCLTGKESRGKDIYISNPMGKIKELGM